MSAVTEWFLDEKPKRVGAYQREYGVIVLFSWWNGRYFSDGYNTPAIAQIFQSPSSRNQNLPWRGLAENPNKDK